MYFEAGEIAAHNPSGLFAGWEIIVVPSSLPVGGQEFLSGLGFFPGKVDVKPFLFDYYFGRRYICIDKSRAFNKFYGLFELNQILGVGDIEDSTKKFYPEPLSILFLVTFPLPFPCEILRGLLLLVNSHCSVKVRKKISSAFQAVFALKRQGIP